MTPINYMTFFLVAGIVILALIIVAAFIKRDGMTFVFTVFLFVVFILISAGFQDDITPKTNGNPDIIYQEVK